jgi:hypothetical protein
MLNANFEKFVVLINNYNQGKDSLLLQVVLSNSNALMHGNIICAAPKQNKRKFN